MTHFRPRPDLIGFDRASWIALCESLAEAAVRSCGLSYQLYVSQFSEAVDAHMLQIEPQDRDQAIDLAERWGYADSTQREAPQRP